MSAVRHVTHDMIVPYENKYDVVRHRPTVRVRYEYRGVSLYVFDLSDVIQYSTV